MKGDSGGGRRPLGRGGIAAVVAATGMSDRTIRKWNQIRHRLFYHISRNGHGIPLVSHEVVVNLIGGARTEAGLEVHAWLDSQRVSCLVWVVESPSS